MVAIKDQGQLQLWIRKQQRESDCWHLEPTITNELHAPTAVN